MQTEKNDVFKIVIVFVIALLFLIPLVYFLLMAKDSPEPTNNQVNFPVKEIVDNEKTDLSGSEFDTKGLLIAYQDIKFEDADWMDKCEGSDWQLGEKKEFIYVNSKYDYSLKIPYTEFYNDDLIEKPFYVDENMDSFTYAPQAAYYPENNKVVFHCGAHGPGPFIMLEVTETKTIDEIKEMVAAGNLPGMDNDYRETKINGFDALTYRTGGYSLYFNVILFGKNYNYHFSGDFPDQEILDLIDTFEVDEKKQEIFDPALNTNNYLGSDEKVAIEFCEESEFSKAIGGWSASVLSDSDLTLKIVINGKDWTENYVKEAMSGDNICGLGDQFIGFIGEAPQYLLFASPCPAAGDAGDDLAACPKRLAEVQKLFE